jgi:hypothetical protein
MRTADLFPETLVARAKPRKLMHVAEACQIETGEASDIGKPLCRMRCHRCAAETDWLMFDSVSEAKRGIPCEACN